MKEILAALTLVMSDYRTKADAALKKLGPLDQIEAGREVLWGLSCLEDSVSCMERAIEQAGEIMGKLPAEVEAGVAAALSAKIAAGELVTQEVLDGAVIAAKEQAKVETETAIAAQVAAEKERADLITARREELVKDQPAEAVALLSDEVIAAETFDNVVKGEFGRRVVALQELGITAKDKPDTFGKIACGSPFNEEGVAAFDATIDIVKSASGFKPKPAGTVAASLLKAGAPPVTPPAPGESAQKKVCAI